MQVGGTLHPQSRGRQHLDYETATKLNVRRECWMKRCYSREAAAFISPPRKGWVETKRTRVRFSGRHEFRLIQARSNGRCFVYPRTLILENDNTACPGVGRPIDIAGRNVVKISILFTSGNSFCEPPGSEMIR